MNLPIRTLLFSTLLLTISLPSFSQETKLRPDKFYTMSGFGLAIPVGENSSFMRPKFSTSIGVNLGLGNAGFFLYPKVSLHAFGYDNVVAEPDYNFELQQGRATTYLLSVALGYRKILNKFSFYAYTGVGGGAVLSPRVMINQETSTAILNNKTNTLATIEPGAGIEFNIGGANLFLETSYMHGLGEVGHKPFNTIPIMFGIKPNLSKLFINKPKR